jgi:hypothetical protein
MENNNVLSDIDQFKFNIDLFDNMLKIFESDMKSTPYSLLFAEYLLNSKDIKPELLKEIKLFSDYISGIYLPLSCLLNSLSKSRSNQDYTKLVEGIQNAFSDTEKKFYILNGMQDILAGDVFYKSSINNLRRHKHLFKHFLIGLKVFVAVESGN